MPNVPRQQETGKATGGEPVTHSDRVTVVRVGGDEGEPEPSVRERDLFMVSAASPEAQELCAIQAAAAALADRAEAWLDAGHGAVCRCLACQHEAAYGHQDAPIRDHLTALAYNLRRFADSFDSDRPRTKAEWQEHCDLPDERFG